MGRKPGVSTGPHKGSLSAWLQTFDVGERGYRETTYKKYASDMRATNSIVAKSAWLKDRKYTQKLITAVHGPEVQYLICVERIK